MTTSLLCPLWDVSQAIPSATDQHQLEDLIVMLLRKTTCQGQTYLAVLFPLANLSGIELSVTLAKTVMRKEGHADGIWGNAGICVSQGGMALVENAENERDDISTK